MKELQAGNMQLWQDKDMAECGAVLPSQAILVQVREDFLEEVVLDYIGQLWMGKGHSSRGTVCTKA